MAMHMLEFPLTCFHHNMLRAMFEHRSCYAFTWFYLFENHVA
jgi:hypothetical protein